MIIGIWQMGSDGLSIIYRTLDGKRLDDVSELAFEDSRYMYGPGWSAIDGKGERRPISSN